MDRTFEWNGATFVVHEATVESAMDADYVSAILSQGQGRSRREMNRFLQYGEFIGTVEITAGDAGFTILSPDADDAAIVENFEAFCKLPKDFRDLWVTAKWSANRKKDEAPASD